MASIHPEMTRIWLSAVAGAALAVACDSTNPPVPLVPRIPSSDVWSGGDLTLVSASFAPPVPLPLVRLGTVTLPVSRVNDSTLTARLPDVNGTLSYSIEMPGFVTFIGSVTVHGFQSSQDGPLLTGFVQAIPGQPWVLGAGDPGLSEVDVRNNTVLRTWPDTVHSPDCTWGVGPSIRPGHYVLFGKAPGGNCTHPWVWQYGAQLVRKDSLFATHVDEWSVAEIGPKGSIAGSDDNLWISSCDVTGCPTGRMYLAYGGSLTGVTIGTTVQRAILHSFSGFLVNATTGDTIRRLQPASNYHLEGAVFSANEDTAFVCGSLQGSHLLMVASATGEVLDSLLVPGALTYDIARDPARPLLYVAAFEGAFAHTRPTLIVVDQGTLTPIATLRAPANEELSLTEWHQFRIVQDPQQHTVYVVATKQVYDLHGFTSKILRFSLLP